MKIGLLTFHNADNYGAVLQCYALQEALKTIGHDVAVIDYRNPYTERIYIPTPLSHFIRCYLHTFRIESWMRVQWQKRMKRILFRNFRRKYLNITVKQYNRSNIPCNFDAYVIGSDQLWNKNCTIDFEPVYFGDFVRNGDSRLYGYAISANVETFKQLTVDELKNISARFDQLSFREQNSSDLLLQKANLTSRVDIDPTLLHTKKKWDKLVNHKYSSRRYVLVYELIKKHDDLCLIVNKANKFAEIHGLEVINISDNVYSIEDFVSLFKYASCVFTTSFHGTVFSLIFNTPLYAFRTGSVRDERYVNLLVMVGAESVVKVPTENPLDYPIMDFHNIDRKLDIMRRDSMSYLERM